MARPSSKTPIKIIVNIKPVKLAEVTPRQRQLAKMVWAHLIATVQDELKAEHEKNKEEVANG